MRCSVSTSVLWATLLALGVSGWLGGKLAYHYGVRVADESVQAEGFETSSGRDERGYALPTRGPQEA